MLIQIVPFFWEITLQHLYISKSRWSKFDTCIGTKIVNNSIRMIRQALEVQCFSRSKPENTLAISILKKVNLVAFTYVSIHYWLSICNKMVALKRRAPLLACTHTWNLSIESTGNQLKISVMTSKGSLGSFGMRSKLLLFLLW